MIISSLVETRTGHLYQGRYKAFLVEDAGRAQRSANLVQLFNLTGTDRVATRVRRAERRRHQSADWRKTVQEVEASLGLNTEHKA